MVRTLCRWTLWPVGIAAFVVAVIHFGDPDDAPMTYVVVSRAILAVIVVFAAIELILPYRQDWRFQRDRDVWRNIGHSALYGNLGGFAATYLVFVGLAPLIAKLNLPSVWPTHAPVVAQILLLIVVGDFLMYWFHRFAHRLPVLWAVHAVHHMPQRINMFMSGRHHIFYLPLTGLFVWVPLMLVGVPVNLIVWQFFAIGLAGNLGHANVDFRIPHFMTWLIVTPQYHRLHHSIDPRYADGNFAVLFPVWDILFGTYADPDATELPASGIEGDPVPHRFFVELGSPFNLKRWKRSTLSTG
jgi:ornithine lipid hydroxylase